MTNDTSDVQARAAAMPTTNPRAWITLTPDEAAEVEWQAKARGMRPADLVHAALTAFLRQPAAAAMPDAGVPSAPRPPVAAPPPDNAEPRGGGGGGTADRLAVAAATLERAVTTLANLLPTAELLRAERMETRAALDDIAEAIGTIAGALAPGGAAADDVAEDVFDLADGR
jgi:hypothetical protein